MKPFLEYNTEQELCLWYHWEDAIRHVRDDMFVGVIAICQHDDGRFVLTKHHKRGREIPGGRRELGETTVETILREVREETGGNMIDPQARAVILWDHHDSDIKHRGVLYTGGWEHGGYDFVDDAIDMALVHANDLDKYLGGTPIGQGGLHLVDYFFGL